MSKNKLIMNIWKIICVSVLCIIFIDVIAGISLFSLGNMRFIIIQPEFAWKSQRGIDFTIFKGTRQLNEGCLFDVEFPGDRHNYEIMISIDRAYFALVDPSKYGFEPLILCNLETNLCWPCDFYENHKDSRMNEIFEILSSEYPQLSWPNHMESN
jgi:hypothetical protein